MKTKLIILFLLFLTFSYTALAGTYSLTCTTNISTCQANCSNGPYPMKSCGCGGSPYFGAPKTICGGTMLRCGVNWTSTDDFADFCYNVGGPACGVGMEATGSGKCMPACTGGKTYGTGETCQCPTGQYVINGVCGVCPTGTEHIGEQCFEICVTGATRDGNGVCQCPAGQEVYDGACVTACATGAIRDAEGQCQCPVGQEVYNGACVTQCVDTQTRANGLCQCPWNQELKDGTCQCSTPKFMFKGVCTSCSPGRTWDDKLGYCVDDKAGCIPPKILVGGVCQQDPIDKDGCTIGYKYQIGVGCELEYETDSSIKHEGIIHTPAGDYSGGDVDLEDGETATDDGAVNWGGSGGTWQPVSAGDTVGGTIIGTPGTTDCESPNEVNPATGRCEPSCPTGQEKVNGECKAICETDWTRDDQGICRPPEDDDGDVKGEEFQGPKLQTKTFEEIDQDFMKRLNAVPVIATANQIASAYPTGNVTCPFTTPFMVLGRSMSFSVMCDWYDQVGGLISITALVCWSLLAVRIFLSA